MLINLILVVGLYIFVGNTGVFSFGHIGFMAIGAYTAGLLRIPESTKQALLQLPGWLERAHVSALEADVIGGLLAALLAAVVALPLMRLGGLTAGLGTFALLNIINIVAANWNQFTGGSTGMAGVPTSTTIGYGARLGADRDRRRLALPADEALPARPRVTGGRAGGPRPRHQGGAGPRDRLRPQRVHLRRCRRPLRAAPRLVRAERLLPHDHVHDRRHARHRGSLQPLRRRDRRALHRDRVRVPAPARGRIRRRRAARPGAARPAGGGPGAGDAADAAAAAARDHERRRGDARRPPPARPGSSRETTAIDPAPLSGDGDPA